MQAPVFKYAAFLSYSHRDNRAGRPWADWLQAALERFTVPSELAGRPGRHGEPVPSRLYPIFQDDKELPTNADLGRAIDEALDQSRYLVVVCSPNAAKSVYVNQEILRFKRLGRANRILAIIVAGEPNATEPAKALDPALECFPPALRHPLDADGNLDLSRRSEPIAADVRGPDGAERSPADKTHAATLEREMLRIAAGLLGVGFDDLVQRDKSRQLQEERARTARLRKLVIGFAALTALAIGAGAYAVIQRAQAERDRAAAERSLAASHFQRALGSIAERSYADAAAFLASTVRLDPMNLAASTRLATLLSHERWMARVARLEHPEAVAAAEFSPDDRWIATISTDRTVRIWDGATGKPRTPPMQHPGGVVFARFLGGGSRVVTGSDDGAIRVWDLSTGSVVSEIRSDKQFPRDGDVHPNGRFVAVSYGNPASVDVWDLSSQTRILRLTSEWSERVFYAAAGSRIVTLTTRAIRVWDADSGRLIAKTPDEKDSGLSGIRISDEGSRILAMSWNGTARVFSAADGSPMTPVLEHGDKVADGDFSPDGQLILTGSWDRTVRLWDRKGNPVADPLQHGSAVGRARFSQDGSRILTSTENESESLARGPDFDDNPLHKSLRLVGEPATRLWDRQTHSPDAIALRGASAGVLNRKGTRVLTVAGRVAELWDASIPPAAPSTIFNDPLTLAADATSDGMVVTGRMDGNLRLWHPARTEPISTLNAGGPVLAVTFSKDGKRLLVTTVVHRNGPARASVWNVATQRLEWQTTSAHDLSAALSDDGKLVAVSIDGPPYRLEIRDIESGREAGAPLPANGPVRALRFSPDSRRLTGIIAGSVRVWDVASAKQVSAANAMRPAAKSWEFSPDRSLAAAVEGRTLFVWRVDTSVPVAAPLRYDSDIRILRFSPDGHLLAVGSADAMVRVLDLRTGRYVGDPISYDDEPGSIEFSSDGSRLVTATYKGTVHVQDVRTGMDLVTPQRNPRGVIAARLVRDDARLFVGWGDGTVKLVDIAPGQAPPSWLPDLAASISGRRVNGATLEDVADGSTLLDQVRAKIANKTDDWSLWAQWLLAAPASRARSPFATGETSIGRRPIDHGGR